jgi:DNA polymerase-3 subunit delta
MVFSFEKQLQLHATKKQSALFVFNASRSECTYLFQGIRPFFDQVLFTTYEQCEQELLGDLFSTYKLLIVQEMDQCPKAQKEKLLSLFQTTTTMCVLLCFESPLDAGNKKFLKLAKAHCSLLDEKPWDKIARLTHIAKNAFEKEKISIPMLLLDQIVKSFNADIMTLINEIEKLICYLGEKKRVDKEDVEGCLSASFETNAWNVGNYFLTKEKYALFGLISHLVQDEQDLIALIYQVRYQLAQFLEMKTFLMRDNRHETFKKHFHLISLNRAKKIQEGLLGHSLGYLQDRLLKLLEFEYIFKKNPSMQHKTTLAYLLVE